MNFKRKHYRSQMDFSDCGIAALAMIYQYHGSYYSLSTLRNMAKTTLDGTSLYSLVKVSENLGFETKAIKADLSIFNQTDIAYPFIVHVIKDESLFHYYVVIGTKNNNIYIADPDPSIKITKISRERFEKEWTGIALFIKPSLNYKIYKEKKSSLLEFLPVVRKQKLLIGSIILSTFLVTIIDIVGAYYLQTVIDIYVPNMLKNMLSIISIGLIITYTFQQILSYTRDYLLQVLSQRFFSSIILSYVRHIFLLPMTFFVTRRTGEIVSRFNDASTIIEALASTILSLFLDFSIITLLSIFLFYQNHELFLISLIIIPLYTIIILSFMKPFQRMNKEMMEANSITSSSIIEDINGIETIKSLTSENIRYKQIEEEFTSYLKKSFTYNNMLNLQNGVKKLVQLLLNVIILWVGSNLVIDGKLSLGQLITYNMMLTYFTNSLESIINLQPKLQTATVANQRLNEVYLIKSEFHKQGHGTLIRDLLGGITLKNVSYSYSHEKDTLVNVNLHIKRNSKITVLGSSGSGKTTLAKILINFFEPSKGEIFFDNINIKDIDKKSLRQFVTYLPQQPYIFNGTILDNLLLGCKKSVSEADILKAVEIAEVKYDIEEMPLSYQTKLTSDNSGISGGQKQRIALARAILTDSPVLILDEATSNLDILTEKRVIENLMKLDKTIIFIAHRLSIARHTDSIIILEKGEIIEQGTHNELIQKDGMYTHLIKS